MSLSPASAGEVDHAWAYEPIRLGASETPETAASRQHRERALWGFSTGCPEDAEAGPFTRGSRSRARMSHKSGTAARRCRTIQPRRDVVGGADVDLPPRRWIRVASVIALELSLEFSPTPPTYAKPHAKGGAPRFRGEECLRCVPRVGRWESAIDADPCALLGTASRTSPRLAASGALACDTRVPPLGPTSRQVS
jgi:hypothetical protein